MPERTNRIYIDAFSGNWGDADGIVTLVVTDAEVEDLNEMTDNQIMAFAYAKKGA